MADRHRETIFAAHTHTQPAQPTTVAHYLLAVVEQLERDGVRLRAAYDTTNRNPLGACAITGTGFPIDRQLTAALLGFDGADRQYLRQHRDGRLSSRERVGRRRAARRASGGSCRICCCGAPRSSAICASATASSRPAASCRRSATRSRSSTCARSPARRSARPQAVVMSVHNTPFGDIVDTEDDLQPLVSCDVPRRDPRREADGRGAGDRRIRCRTPGAGGGRGLDDR